jgi:methylmalonyl-CoA mutase
MNGAVLPVLAAFIVAAEEQGVPPEALAGTIQNDILKEFMVRNTYIYPPAPSLRIVADIIEFTVKFMPRFNSVSISGYHMQEAGASLAQELAYTLADGREYVRLALKRGLKVDDFAPRLSFFFGIGMDFFAEVAKLRAARLLWHEIMAGFQPQKTESLVLRMHCQTSGVSLQAQDPLNNITRTAYEALAAVLGGTQSLHTNSWDEALALPGEDAARIARNTQLILLHETKVAGVADPLGGSWYVERLTADLAEAARGLMAEVEAAGGMVAALEAGLPDGRIRAEAMRRQAAVERGEAVIVGVNRFEAPVEAAAPPLREIDADAVRKSQTARLAGLRARRDSGQVAARLAALEAAARSGEGNLLALAIPAMRARATVGEVSAALERVFGRYRAEPVIRRGIFAKGMDGSAEIEAVREGIRRLAERLGRAPRLMVAKLGQDGHDRGAGVISGAFADLGFEVLPGPLFQAPAEAASAAVAARVDVLGLSSLAAGHRTHAPEVLRELSARGGQDIAVVLGGVVPEGDVAVLKQHGIKAVFGPGTPVLAAAREVVRLIGERLDARR